MRITRLLFIVISVAVLAVGGCSSSDDTSDTTTSAAGGATEISVLNFRFDPGDVTVSVGDSVTWTNDATASHTTTATDGAWNTQLGAGESFTQTFDTAGTFDFFCAIHPAMTGTVTVAG